MSEITIKIDKTVQKHNMLCRGDFVVVGVSGGADSMLLLSYLIKKRQELDLRLLVANVEHGIRGSESVADSEFVERFCKENKVEFSCLKIDAPALAQEDKMGVEEYSRKRRYEFFESFNSDKIATAHNLSDNVETVLFRLSRGTSPAGCGGIPYKRERIIRPLLDVSSKEIREECANKGIPFVVDSTNADNNYSRNYIRNVVVQDFIRLNPSFEKAVDRFIKSSCEDNDYLKKEAEKCFADCENENGLDIEKLKKYHSAVSKRAIIMLAEKNSVSLDELHLNGVFELLSKSGKFQIKNKYFALSDLKNLRICEIDNNEINFSLSKKIVEAEYFLNNCELLKKEFDFYFDYDKIIGSICVRERMEGDKISPVKRNCTKSLKKLFNEKKIPSDKRRNFPIVADDNGVIAVKGICIDKRVCLDENTKKILLISITEDKN